MAEQQEERAGPKRGQVKRGQAKRGQAARRKQPKPNARANAERKARIRAEREAKAGGGEVNGIAGRLERIEASLSRQSELSKQLLVKVEALVDEPETVG
jgi:hypothetical protein